MPTHLLFFGMWEIGVLTGPLENACSSAPWRCSLAFLPGSEQGSISAVQGLLSSRTIFGNPRASGGSRCSLTAGTLKRAWRSIVSL